MFDSRTPRVFSIKSGAPFVDVLAARLLAEHGGDPLTLADIRILLPTRRACRSLAEAFLRLSSGKAILLPRMTPLGDIDEEELSINEAGIAPGEGTEDLPPAIPALRRQMMLTRAIMTLPEHRLQPEQAAALALELAKLIDRLATENCEPEQLRELVGHEEDYAEHWQKVLRFLEILITKWPDILKDEGALDPAARRNALLGAQARLWLESPPKTPVIAAGSTGSIPATADLLGVVAGLPKGAVILPGLDQNMPDEAWSELGPTHPQYGLRQLLQRLDIARDAVTLLDAAHDTSQADLRSDVLSAAMLPANAEAITLPGAAEIDAAFADVSRLDCPGPSEEASAIALIMRRTLETPAKTCALVTPDRALARRVQAALSRWGIEVDDSAGAPLSATPPGSFLRLIADACHQQLAPVPLLALLKHPLASGGMAASEFRALTRQLETELLRGPRPAPGLRGLKHERSGPQVTRLIKVIERVLSPLVDQLAKPAASFKDILAAHIESAERLASDDNLLGAQRLWAGDDGEAAAHFVAEMDDAIAMLGEAPTGGYARLFDVLMRPRVVRKRFGAHPRLAIWGLLEARLQHADTVILGGLNEGTWPPASETNPWMSRPMMTDMGLEPPERRIGLTAHDFQQAISAPEIYITRAERLGGAPTVPSRWLLRLDNLLERTGKSNALAPNPADNWLGWVNAIDFMEYRKVERPQPKPPIEARPKTLSVTQIETLIRDPYSIYARHILGLKPLDPIDADPNAADRGNIIHKALERFVETYPDALPDDAERRLLEIGEAVFGDYLARPGVRAFWWPRFERIAEWFVSWQRARLEQGWKIAFAEDTGHYIIDAIEGGFDISAKPDRIDYLPGYGLSIIDYKTGNPPTARQVESGLSPQLPLEAVMAEQGAFPNVPAEPAAELMYVQLSGGRKPGEAKTLKLDVADVIDKTREGVHKLITTFANADHPYLSNPRPQFENRFGDYDHLARQGEWGGDGDDE